MMTISEYTELAVPDYALSYLVNGDSSGIDDDDKKTIDEWYQQFIDEAQAVSGHIIFDASSEDSYFTWDPEFGLACECCNCTILIVK